MKLEIYINLQVAPHPFFLSERVSFYLKKDGQQALTGLYKTTTTDSLPFLENHFKKGLNFFSLMNNDAKNRPLIQNMKSLGGEGS